MSESFVSRTSLVKYKNAVSKSENRLLNEGCQAVAVQEA